MKQKKKNKKLCVRVLIAVSLFFLAFNVSVSSTSFDGKTFIEDGFVALKNFSIAPSVYGQGTAMSGEQTSYENINGDSSWFVQGVNWILYGFFCFFSWMLGLSGFLFDWAVDAENIRNVIHREAIYNAWKMVRDFLNLGFILILLYSAFCTVFQIEKYHLKKILLMLVLMALLVNFSFPISRFIVDASNVTMYFFLQSAFGDASTSFSAGFVKFTNIAEILVPRDKAGDFDSSGSTTEIIMATFFVICLMISMFVIAAILVIRIVALAVLIIFSSIGFVAAVLPDTKTFANKWWSNLFKYAFAGPILVFMVLLALSLMKELAVEGTLENMKATAVNYGSDPSKLANAAYFFIPIVLLWVGIFATRTMSIFGANWITGKATSMAKTIPRIPFKGARFVATTTGVAGGAKEGYKHFRKTGKLFGGKKPLTGLYGGSDERERREAKIGGFFTGGKPGWDAMDDKIKNKRMQEKVDENKKLNVSASQLDKDLSSADEATRMAAAVTMSEKGLLTDINRFEGALKAVGNNADLKQKIIDKAPKDITRGAITDSDSLNKSLTAVTILKSDGTKDDGATEKLQESIRGSVGADNNVKILIDHDEKYGGKSKAEAYQNNLEKLSTENLAEQKNLLDTDEFHKFFLRDKKSGGPAEDLNFISKVAEKMNTKNRLDWRKRGYTI